MWSRQGSRHPVWFERALLPDLVAEVEQRSEVLGPATADEPFAGLAGAHGAVAGGYAYDAGFMDRAPNIRVIARTGIGVDKVDLAEATRRGIAVCNTPDGPTVSTAEHTMALILAVAKNVKLSETELRAGAPNLLARHRGIELEGTTLGLAGFGRIARRVAAAARGLGMSTLAYDPFLQPADFGDTVPAASLGEVLQAADVVSIHIPLTPENARSFGAEQFGAMKDGAVFINAARGGLVDHDALLAAVDSGKLHGAGLDVTDPEPLDPSHPLLHRDNVVVTPHVASATHAGKRRLFGMAFAQVIQALDGERPPHLLNPEVWETVRSLEIE